MHGLFIHTDADGSRKAVHVAGRGAGTFFLEPHVGHRVQLTRRDAITDMRLQAIENPGHDATGALETDAISFRFN
jgi:hypothetical protein